MPTAQPDVHNYVDQIRSRIQAAERKFGAAVSALKGEHAAQGRLRSGATIKRSLTLLAAEFDQLTDTILAYLGKTLARTGLDPAQLLDATASALLQSKIAFKSMVDPGQLRSFAPTKGVDRMIEDAFAEMDSQLTLRLQEFAFGLSDHAPTATKAESPAVTNTISIGTNIGNVQQGAHNSSQTVSIALSATVINAALDQFEASLVGLPDLERAKMTPDVVALRAQASKATLTEGALRETGKSLRGIAEGIAGNLATPAFIAACEVLWSALGIG